MVSLTDARGVIRLGFVQTWSCVFIHVVLPPPSPQTELCPLCAAGKKKMRVHAGARNERYNPIH